MKRERCRWRDTVHKLTIIMETISHLSIVGQAREVTTANYSDEPESAFGQFVARQELQEVVNSLRWVSSHPAAPKYERYLLEWPISGKARAALVATKQNAGR